MKYEVYPQQYEQTGIVEAVSKAAIAATMEASAKFAEQTAKKLEILKEFNLSEPKLMVFLSNDGRAVKSIKLVREAENSLGKGAHIFLEVGSHKFFIREGTHVEPSIKVGMDIREGQKLVTVSFELSYDAKGTLIEVSFGGRLSDTESEIDNFQYSWYVWNKEKPSPSILKLGLEIARGKLTGTVRQMGFEGFFAYCHKMGFPRVGNPRDI